MGIEEDIQQRKKFNTEFERALVNLIYTNSWLNQNHMTLLKPFGITTPQFNILRILRGQHPEPSTVNMLIERMLDKSSNASRIVDKLEEKKLVIRKQCSGDRRAVDVFISDKGLELLSQLDDALQGWQASFQNITEDECRELNQLLDKIRG